MLVKFSLDAEDSDSVRSFSSECLELLEPLEEQEESEDEDVPKSKVFATLLKMATIFFLENYASYNCMHVPQLGIWSSDMIILCLRPTVRILVVAMTLSLPLHTAVSRGHLVYN